MSEKETILDEIRARVERAYSQGFEWGRKQLISEFVNNIQCTLSDYSSWEDMKEGFRKLIRKWEEKLK